MAMCWLTVMVRNLLYLFYYRRVHRYYTKGLSKEVLRFELACTFILLEQPLWDPG